ncbi:ATP-binding protein [Candidatus Woesearchaeota archaeon]|nr:ATP-binding protein [Candidatus Woesearchaeota archaeon]
MAELTKTILNEWKEKTLPEVISRETDLLGYADTKPNKIVVITGFRRTGKTFLIFSLIQKLLKEKSKEQAVYVNFEDERIPLKTEFLTNLLPAIKQMYNKQLEFLFLDEVHNIPEWSKWLRRVYDSEKIRIFVTGSSSKMSSKEIPTELRGRFLEVKVFPLNFKEYLKFNNKSINLKVVDHSENEKAKIIRAFKDYLEFGGMPEVVLADEDRKIEIIHNYYNTVIRRDIIERFKIRNQESLKALLNLLLNSTSYSISKLYNTLKSLNFEVGKGTIQSYLSYIENSYFLHSLQLFSLKIKDQMQYPRKIYLIDNGFITALSSKFSKNLGRLYENLIFLELKRKLSSDPKQDAYYWRNQQKEEVDFVIKQGLKVKQLIQSCYEISDYDTKKREIRALVKASKELKCNNLLIITEDKEGEEKIEGKKIKYTPLWRWLLM